MFQKDKKIDKNRSFQEYKTFKILIHVPGSSLCCGHDFHFLPREKTMAFVFCFGVYTLFYKPFSVFYKPFSVFSVYYSVILSGEYSMISARK